MCYATGIVPCSDECADAGRCLLSIEDSKPTRIIIAGGREFNDPDYMAECMDGVLRIHGGDKLEVVSGGARGADALGEEWANSKMIPVDVKDAEWKVYGRRAGLIRNDEMAMTSQVLCAFWDGHSTGTRHMIYSALKNGLEVHVFRYKDVDEEMTGDLFDDKDSPDLVGDQ